MQLYLGIFLKINVYKLFLTIQTAVEIMRMHFKNLLAILFLGLLLATQNADAQRWKLMRYHVGAGFGPTQVFGDIGGAADENNWYGLKDLSIDETSLAYHINAGFKIDNRFAVKSNLTYASGKGSDAGTPNERGRSYKVNFIEFSGQAEYYFLSEDPRLRSAAVFDKKGMINNFSTISAYGFAGLGLTYSMASHEKGTYMPDADSYKETNLAPVIPFGVGVKYVIDKRWFIGAEFGYRWAMNDYIEGYSQLKGSKHNDMYYFLLLTANYRIKTSRRGIPTILDRKVRYSL